MRRQLVRLPYLLLAAWLGVCCSTSILIWCHLLGWHLPWLASAAIVVVVIGGCLRVLPPLTSELEAGPSTV